MKVKSAFGALALIALVSVGCASIPRGAAAVSGFDLSRYLGTWYEIGRFDFAFEKDLSDTTATYDLNADGTVAVLNRGYNYVEKRWQEAKGVARFRGDATVGALEVSFFGPFFSPYNVIVLDPEYRYVLVAGNSTKYLWILSRTKELPREVRDEYVAIAERLGYDMSQFVWVKHE